MVVCDGVEIVDKVWGREIVNVNNSLFCSKKLMLMKGAWCSKHCHMEKLENFALVKGHIMLEVGDEVIDMHPGMNKTIFPGQYHRFAGYEDSEIFEASTHHDDGDVYRLEDSFLAMELYAVDVDGTLECSGGIVKRAHLSGKEFVIVSSRSTKRSLEACEMMKLTPLSIINSRILSKTEELRCVDRMFPIRRTVYIGDQDSDRVSALKAGWKFMTPKEFVSLEEMGC
jgi:mannose-6-phosphate isomerase-like protein (cupin superfamily)